MSTKSKQNVSLEPTIPNGEAWGNQRVTVLAQLETEAGGINNSNLQNYSPDYSELARFEVLLPRFLVSTARPVHSAVYTAVEEP
jgi:hypothetical protein